MILASAGSARAPGGRTLTFLDDTPHAKQAFIDSAPNPLRAPPDRRGFACQPATRSTSAVRSSTVRTASGSAPPNSQFIVVKGNSFANAVFRGHGALWLHDGQITADGLFRPANPTNTIAVLGGTGAYEGARGSLTFTEVTQGSRETVHISP